MENIIRVAVFSGYGGDSVPKEILDKMVCKDLYSAEFRVELAKILDALPVNCKEEKEFVSTYKRMQYGVAKTTYIKYMEDKRPRLYLRDDSNYSVKYPVEIEIRDIDMSKPWRVVEYDGAESIEVFSGVSVKEEKYNMCEW